MRPHVHVLGFAVQTCGCRGGSYFGNLRLCTRLFLGTLLFAHFLPFGHCATSNAAHNGAHEAAVTGRARSNLLIPGRRSQGKSVCPTSRFTRCGTHASQLIGAGIDVVTVSKRLEHSKPTVTLNTYARLFSSSDDKAAAAVNDAIAKIGR
jgi:hypothetical protein